ncbi:hypothetical protein B0J14DRAFT_603237 [Halenospora varia]|nr:hypothetical protein B0J14DRAFT_603237 [Halenospora varia]
MEGTNENSILVPDASQKDLNMQFSSQFATTDGAIMEPNLVNEFLRLAERDEKIQDRDFEPFLQAKDHPLFRATTIALRNMPYIAAYEDRHPPMAFANPETYASGEPAYDINLDSDDWGGLANVAQMRFGHYLEGSKFLGYELCVSQPKTVDLTNKLEHAKWLVEALVKFRQYQNGFFVLVGHGLGKTFAIAKIGENRTLVTSPEQRGEPATLRPSAEGFFFEPEDVANEVIQVERFLFWRETEGNVWHEMFGGKDNDEDDEHDEHDEESEDSGFGSS